MKFHLLVILLLLLPCSVSAQRIKIAGVVSDAAGLPIELATVQVKGTMNGTLTNEKGQYTLSVAPKDSLTIVFTCLGYNRVEAPVESPQEDRVLNVQMRPQSYELETAVITANRIQTNTMEKISMGQGRLSVDATGGSVESFVMTAGTGVSSTNELSTQYSVRGGNYNENIVYVNGIEIYRPLLIRNGQQEGLSFINPDLTQSVRFSSGGFDARYGDKMSSVLDVTYKNPEKLEGGFTGSMLGGSAYLGSVYGKFSQITGFRYKRGTTLLNTLDTRGDYNPSVMDLQTFMNYAFTPALTLSFIGNYSDNSYDFNPGDRETSYGTSDSPRKFKAYFDGMEKDRFRTLFGAATLQYTLSERADLALQVSGFQSREEETYDITGEYWLSNVLEEGEDNIGTGLFHQHARDQLQAQVFNASLSGRWELNQNTLRWSLGGQRENIKDRINEWELRDSMGYSLPSGEAELKVFRNLYSKNQTASQRFSGYIQDTYKFRGDAGLFSLTAGIRGSYWNYNREFLFSPRASFGFVPGGNQRYTFRLATGIYYQSPFYKEFRVTQANEAGDDYIRLNQNIRSQRSIHFVLGGDYSFRMQDGRPFKFTAELYYKKLDHLVPYSVNNVRVWYSGENSSHGYATGIDTKLFGQFVPETDSWVGFSLMQARQYINGEKVAMPTDQLYNFTLYFSDYLPKTNKRLQGNLRAIWAQGLPFSVPGNEYKPRFHAPPYRRIDFGMTYRLWGEDDRSRSTSFWTHFRNIWLGVDVFNLFDIKNVSSYSWFSDVKGVMHAVPDKLTGRQFNLKLVAE
ncbi:MAG: TonB-dependent receptor, partial [Dysgonamonadaceae bacterium]|nr:TonB-dependent receptor [Dysgonamonadaceae bacterium]